MLILFSTLLTELNYTNFYLLIMLKVFYVLNVLTSLLIALKNKKLYNKSSDIFVTPYSIPPNYLHAYINIYIVFED